MIILKLYKTYKTKS